LIVSMLGVGVDRPLEDLAFSASHIPEG